MKRILLLLLFLPSLVFAADDPPVYAFVLPDAATSVTKTIHEKDYFAFLIFKNTSDTTLVLKDIDLLKFVETSTGQQAIPEMTLDGNPATSTYSVPAYKSVQIEIRCQFPKFGTYHSQLSMLVTHNETSTPASQTFKISYEKEPKTDKPLKDAFYEVSSTYHGAGIIGDLKVQMVLKDILGKGGTIAQVRPELSKLGENAAVNSAAYGPILMLIDEDTLDVAVEFEAGSPVRILTLDFTGIRKPGNYKGAVHFSSKGDKPVKAEFTLSVRRHFGWAILVISAGLLAAILLRWLLTVVQPKIKNQLEVAKLMEQAEDFRENNDLGPEENALLADYLRQLEELYERLESETPADLAAQLDILKKKEDLFREWVEARGQIFSLDPPSMRETLLPNLNETRQYIALPGGDLETAKTLTLWYANLAPNIRKLVKEYIKGQAEQLAATAEKELQAAGVDPTKIKEFLQRAEKVKNLPADTNAELDALKDAFSDLQDRYITLLMGGMRKQLEALRNGTRPEGVDAGAWIQVFDPAEKALENAQNAVGMEDRIAEIKEATRLLLKGIAAELEAHKNRLEKKKAVNPLISDELIEQAGRSHQEAAELLGKWGDMSLEEAMKAFGGVMQKAQASWGTVAVFRDGHESRTESPSLSFFRWGFSSRRMGFNMEGTDLGRLENFKSNLARLRWRKFISEAISSILIFIISVGLGLMIWWVPNPTWGSLADILTAIFWGFGLHTISKSTDITGTVTKFIQGKITG